LAAIPSGRDSGLTAEIQCLGGIGETNQFGAKKDVLRRGVGFKFADSLITAPDTMPSVNAFMSWAALASSANADRADAACMGVSGVDRQRQQRGAANLNELVRIRMTVRKRDAAVLPISVLAAAMKFGQPEIGMKAAAQAVRNQRLRVTLPVRARRPLEQVTDGVIGRWHGIERLASKGHPLRRAVQENAREGEIRDCMRFLGTGGVGVLVERNGVSVAAEVQRDRPEIGQDAEFCVRLAADVALIKQQPQTSLGFARTLVVIEKVAAGIDPGMQGRIFAVTGCCGCRSGRGRWGDWQILALNAVAIAPAIWLTTSSDMVVTPTWKNADPAMVGGNAGTNVGKNASIAS
jgi:hypothetical protein